MVRGWQCEANGEGAKRAMDQRSLDGMCRGREKKRLTGKYLQGSKGNVIERFLNVLGIAGVHHGANRHNVATSAGSCVGRVSACAVCVRACKSPCGMRVSVRMCG